MKKKIVIVLLLILLLFSVDAPLPSSVKIAMSPHKEDTSSLIIFLLMPSIQKELQNFYQPYFAHAPGADANFVFIQRIEVGAESTKITVTLEVEPLVGAHVPVGRDKMTFEVSAGGTTVVKEFVHLESNSLPAHLQPLLLKPLP